MSLELWLAVTGVALAVAVWRAHRQLARHVDPSAASRPLRSYPSVSVIRPVRGLDAGAVGNIRAALDTGYPGEVETLFVLDDEREPALSLILRAIAEAAASGAEVDARVLYCGRPPEGRTGKLNAMIVGLARARGEVVVFADSDIRPGTDALRSLVETLLADDQAGAAFAPTVAVESGRTAGDVGYSLLLNGLYGPAFNFVANRKSGRMPFIMGQFMAWRREAIAAIGGLETADGQLVDDMYLGMRVVEEGYHNVVSPCSVPIIQHGLSLTDFLSTYVRWLTFSRSGLPGRTFKLMSWTRGAVFWAGLLLFAATLLMGLWWAAAFAAIAPVATAASINVLHRTQGGGAILPRHLWVAFGLLLSAPAVMTWILTHREVTWRGRRYALDASSRLASSSVPTVPADVPTSVPGLAAAAAAAARASEKAARGAEAEPISAVLRLSSGRAGLDGLPEPLSVSEPVSVSSSVAG